MVYILMLLHAVQQTENYCWVLLHHYLFSEQKTARTVSTTFDKTEKKEVQLHFFSTHKVDLPILLFIYLFDDSVNYCIVIRTYVASLCLE